MTAPTTYEIGTTYEGMTPVTTAGFPEPEAEYYEYVEVSQLGSGVRRGIGLPYAVWHWGYLTQDQYEALRDYCSGTGAVVYIATIDSNNDFKRYSGNIEMPEKFTIRAWRRIDITVNITELVEIPEPPEEE